MFVHTHLNQVIQSSPENSKDGIHNYKHCVEKKKSHLNTNS